MSYVDAYAELREATSKMLATLKWLREQNENAELRDAQRTPLVIPSEKTADCVIGWRVWPVSWWEDAHGKKTVRLLSYNGHAAWQPREAMHAVCRGVDHESIHRAHDAPQLDCRCGVWAFKDEGTLLREFEACMYDYMRTELGYVSWALGRVSLWGRVLEFKRGYRAEYAYPYSLSVYTDTQAAARAVRDAYVTDVDWHRPGKERQLPRGLKPPKLTPQTPKPPSRGLNASEDEVLLALASAHIIEESEYRWKGGRANGGAVWSSNVLDALEWSRGTSLTRAWGTRDAKRVERQVIAKLKRLAENDLVEYGRPGGRADSLKYRLSPEGLRRVRALGIPNPIPVLVFPGPHAAGITNEGPTLLKRAMAHHVDLVPSDAFKPKEAWTVARKKAQAKGAAHYQRWLNRWREETPPGVNRLRFDDDEILDAMSTLHASGKPALLVNEVHQQLAPGSPSSTERAHLTGQMTSLRKQGLIRRAGRENGTYGALLWQVEEEARAPAASPAAKLKLAVPTGTTGRP